MKVESIVDVNELKGQEVVEEKPSFSSKLRKGLKTVGKFAMGAIELAGDVAGIAMQFDGACSLAKGLVLGAQVLSEFKNNQIEEVMGE